MTSDDELLRARATMALFSISMADGASCKCSSCGRRGAAQARAWSIRILRHMVTRWHFGKLFIVARMVPTESIEVPLFLNTLKVPEATTKVKPGRLGKAAREKAGLERKGGPRNSTSEEKDAPHALADEVYEEETPMKLWQGWWLGEFGGTRGRKGKSLAFALSGHWVESWVAPPDALEEVVLLVENESVMDCEEIFTELAEAITPVGDRTWRSPR